MCTEAGMWLNFIVLKFRLGSASEPNVCSHCYSVRYMKITANNQVIMWCDNHSPTLCHVLLPKQYFAGWQSSGYCAFLGSGWDIRAVMSLAMNVRVEKFVHFQQIWFSGQSCGQLQVAHPLWLQGPSSKLDSCGQPLWPQDPSPTGPPGGGQLCTSPIGPPGGGQLCTSPIGPPGGGQLCTSPIGPPRGSWRRTAVFQSYRTSWRFLEEDSCVPVP